MNKKDLLVLACLRENSRQKLIEISKKTKIPISTIFDRIKIYNREIIKKNTTLVDFAKLGFNTRASIVIKVERGERNALQEYLIKNHHVNSLSKINNGFDFLIEAVFKQIKEVEEFLEDIEDKFKVKSKGVYYIIDDLKKEGFLSDITSVDLI